MMNSLLGKKGYKSRLIEPHLSNGYSGLCIKEHMNIMIHTIACRVERERERREREERERERESSPSPSSKCDRR